MSTRDESEGYLSNLSTGKTALLEQAFKSFREHATKHGPELQLTEDQETWLKILIAPYLPEPGPAVVQRGQPCKLASITELRALGVLLEANRQFFHPLGLALETVKHTLDDGREVVHLHAVWDERDDPEGIAYSDEAEYWDTQAEKLLNFEQFRSERHTVRASALGYVVQPVTGTAQES